MLCFHIYCSDLGINLLFNDNRIRIRISITVEGYFGKENGSVMLS
jgi:hypothetical protein